MTPVRRAGDAAYVASVRLTPGDQRLIFSVTTPVPRAPARAGRRRRARGTTREGAAGCSIARAHCAAAHAGRSALSGSLNRCLAGAPDANPCMTLAARRAPPQSGFGPAVPGEGRKLEQPRLSRQLGRSGAHVNAIAAAAADATGRGATTVGHSRRSTDRRGLAGGNGGGGDMLADRTDPRWTNSLHPCGRRSRSDHGGLCTPRS